MTVALRKMDELCEITSSKRIFAADYVEEGVPFYRGKEITEKFKGNPDVSTELFIAEEKFIEIEQKFGAPLEGDLLLTSVGTLGSPYVVEPGERFYFKDGNLTWFRNFKGLHSRYLYYWLVSPQGKAELQKCTIGSSQSAFTIALLKGIEIELPSPIEQRRIAGILSAYDELIANHQRRIAVLEQMARALYREWFVYFRAPGVVMNEGADLPEGWEVREFRDLFDIRYGKTLPKTEVSDSGVYPVYGAGDVIGFYHKMLQANKCALVTSRGNGSGTVWRTREAAFVTNNSLLMLAKEEFKHWDYSFIELLLLHSNVMEAKTGSAQPQVTIENLNYVKGLLPSKEVVERFCAFVTPLYEQVDVLYRIIANLRRTRDLLLPRLMSERVEVTEHRDHVEA